MKNIKEEIQQWEDSKNIKPKKKNSKLNEDGIRNIIGKIKKRSIEKIEKDIIEIKTKIFLQKLKDKGYYYEEYDYSRVEYKGMFIKIIVIDKKYDSEHLITPNHLLIGSGCTLRNVINKNDYFIKKSIEVHGNKYDYSKFKYINHKTKSIIICHIHGEFLQTSNRHLLKRGCKLCWNERRGQTQRLTIEEILNRCNETHGEKYEYPDLNYKNARTKITIKCKKCNYVFEQTIDNHLNKNKGCPQCKQSKGENKIKVLFDSLNMEYDYQKTFKKCKDKKKLFFDFYVKKFNLLIEYNGKQHYKSIEFFGGEKDFIKRQKRDKIKIDYCKKNNINLLIIPYTKFNNIEEIVMNKVNEIVYENSMC